MTAFALTSLMTFVCNFCLGAFIYFRDPKSNVHRLFFFTSLSLAAFSLVEFGYRQAHNFEEAAMVWQFDVIWPTPVATWLHLALVLGNHRKWLRKKITYIAIYGPACLFVLLDLFGNHITGSPVLKPWGWSFGFRETLISRIGYIWVFIGPVIAAFFLVNNMRHAKDPQTAAQAKLLSLAAVVPILAQLTDYIVIQAGIELPSLLAFGLLSMNTLVAYAIWKYELFSLNPETAAKSIVDTMADSFILVDLNGIIQTVNNATCKMTGYTAEELLDKPFSILFAPGMKQPPADEPNTFNSRFPPMFTQHIDTMYRTKDGKAIPVLLSTSTLYNRQNQPKGSLLLARDITEIKRTTEELAQHEAQLEELIQERTLQLTESTVHLQEEINERQKAESEKRNLESQLFQAQKMEAIGRLAGGVAHDFNNLLFIINGYCETLRDELPTDSPLMHDVDEISEAGHRAVNLTRQLLAFSRKQVIEPIKINLNERLESTKKMFSRLIGEEYSLQISPAVDLGSVVMDVTQLDQIIANLIINAKDAMVDGGVIRITTENTVLTKADCIGRSERTPGSYITLSVQDKGCGITPDEQKLIFEPFYTTKRSGKGTGLGLATVYGIVKQNNGFIELQSEPQKGTTFQLFFPRADQYIDAGDSYIDPSDDYRGTETILLVEDNHAVRRLARRQLFSNGYRVIEAVNGVTALNLYEKHQANIDLIVTDVVMPQMSGPRMVQQLEQSNPEIKVLYISGNNDELVNKHGLSQSRHPLLVKPFSARELCNKVRKVLDGRISILSPPPMEKAPR